MQHRPLQWVQIPDQSLESYLTMPELQQAAKLIQDGELVAFPTETVYGLGADATSEQAVQKIFQAKGRPSDNPLIVHFAEQWQVKEWVTSITPLAARLMERFWPGPLTLVVHHNGRLTQHVTAGLDTIAIRLPAHPVARALIKLAARPIAAPSANSSGRPSPTTAEHVWHDLAGRIAMLLDAGTAMVGVESTVLDVTGEQAVLLRPGGVTVEAIEQEVGRIVIDPGIQNSTIPPRSPGMKYRHYAPDGELLLVTGEVMQVVNKIQQLANQARAAGKKVGVLTTTEQQDQYVADLVIACGSRTEPETVAKQLYQALHQFNEANIDLILAETFPEQGVFYSVMNRLRKAAGGQII